jgi:hypothetical protein
MGLEALLNKLESRENKQGGRNAPPRLDDGLSISPERATADKRQISCRAFLITRILMATKSEHCLDRQGDHCSDCVLRIKATMAVF